RTNGVVFVVVKLHVRSKRRRVAVDQGSPSQLRERRQVRQRNLSKNALPIHRRLPRAGHEHGIQRVLLLASVRGVRVKPRGLDSPNHSRFPKSFLSSLLHRSPTAREKAKRTS